MVNVKSYKDGDRLVLVVENCTGELAEKVNHFLAEILDIVPVAKPVPGLAPLENEDEPQPDISNLTPVSPGEFKEAPTIQAISKYVFSSGQYKGKTFEYALKKNGVAAAISIACSIKSIEQPLRDSILKYCKQMIAKDLASKDVQNDSFDAIGNFFEMYKPLAIKGIQQILSMSGYASLEEFMVFSDEKTIRDAYEALIKALIERIQ